MKEKLKVVVTPATVLFAGITIAAAIVLHFLAARRWIGLMNIFQAGPVPPAEVSRLQASVFLIDLPLMLLMSVLPVLWAWQNYRVYEKETN